jgi:Polyketide cyclase / dehydrase and lipid transport
MPSKPIRIETIDWADAPIAQAFDAIIPVELSKVFTGYGPIPAVTETTDQTGPWDGEGQTRTIHLADGSRTHEVIAKFEHPTLFQYRVGPFTGAFGNLIDHADGEFFFKPVAQGTSVRWSYSWYAKAPWMSPLLWVFTRFWKAYSRKSLYACVKHAEESARTAEVPA